MGNTSYTSRKHTEDYSVRIISHIIPYLCTDAAQTPIEIMKTVVVDTGGDIPLDLEHCRLET